MDKVSVIIATKNDGERLIKTLDSFFGQSYLNKELIIVDGGDRKNTETLIEKYKVEMIYQWSEPRGISDAFNIGLKNSSGDYLYFMGAGDYFWAEDVLEKMMDGVDSKVDMFVCGKINRISEDGKSIKFTSSINFNKYLLQYKMGLPHQALFTSKKYFDKYGIFDVNCKYAMDYEMILRSYHNFPKVILKNVVVAAWRDGGLGKNNTELVWDEYKRIRIKNKIAPRFLIDIIDWAVRAVYVYFKK